MHFEWRSLWVWAVAAVGAVVLAQAQQEQCSDKDGTCEADYSSSSSETQQQAQQQAQQPKLTTMGTHQVLETAPHDPKAFTQGLELWNETHMLESIGLYGESAIRLVEIATGKVVQETKLDAKYFAEGLTRCKDEANNRDEVIVLTWKENLAIRYKADTLEVQSAFPFRSTTNEGWGLACFINASDDSTSSSQENHQRVYVSDGSSYLHHWHGVTMQELSKVMVHWQWHTDPVLAQGQGLKNDIPHVNELEMDVETGDVLANVWYQDILLRIQPDTGFVKTVYDLQTLRPKETRGRSEDCLNGIAQVSKNVYWVTGKLWPLMYKIRLVEAK